jgi:hypothetical protein
MCSQNPESAVAAEAASKFENLLANNAEAGLRTEAVRSDGSAFPALIQLCPMKDAGGACKFVVVVVLDESGGERRDSLFDIASVGTALHDMMGAASTLADVDYNPFEELDAKSGQLAPKVHAAHDRCASSRSQTNMIPIFCLFIFCEEFSIHF